jgi:hypothetical protein
MGVVQSLMEVQATGSDNNSGLFDTQASMTSTLSATSANTASPAVTASNYTFTANDVGHYLFVKPSGAWKCGWYRIASVTSGAATLIASVGTVFGGDKQPNTTVGISTNSTDSGGTWAVDYTQKNTSLISYTDLVAVSASQLTSAANPFTPNLIGNSIQILSGTGFPPNIYIINSLTGSAANFHVNFATPGSTGGTGNLGGALATVHKACGMIGISSNYVYVKGSAGIITVSSNAFGLNGAHSIIGYQNNRWDNLKATIRLGASGARFLTSGDGRYVYLHNLIIDGQGYSDTRATSFGNNQRSYIYNCEFRNLTYGLWAQGGFQTDNCIFENITTSPFGYSTGSISRCIFKNCNGSVGNPVTVDRCIFFGGTTNIYNTGALGQVSNNTFYNIAADGVYFYNNYGTTIYNTAIIYNNIFSNISGYAIHYSNSGSQYNVISKNNAYFACTSGNFSNGAGNNPIVGNIQLVSQIQLSSSPFVNPSTGDFRLNNDLTGGRLCRGTSISSNGVITPNNDALDIGAVQTTSYSVDRTLGPLSKTVDMKANTTSYSEYINLASTGYTFNTATLKAYYVRPNLTSTSISLASQTVSGTWVSGGFVEVDPINMPGLYRFDVPNEVIASGVSNSMLQIVNTSNNDRVNINYKFFDSQILDLSITVPTNNIDQTVGDALNAARAYGFGKWIINGNNLEYYAPDNSTIIKTFTLDNPNYPRSRGSIFSTNGLVMNLDAKNTSSYPGSGNTWFDISGYSNNVTLTNGPVWNALGYFANDIDSYFTGAGTAAIPVGNSSYSMFVYVRMATWSGQRGFISIGGYGTNNQSNAITSNATIGYFSHYWWFNDLVISNNNANIALNRWFYLGVTFDGTTRKVYVDGIVVGSDTPINHNVTSTTIQISKTYQSEYQVGDVAAAQIYNRAITVEEVGLNLLYLRNRFGL